MNRRITSCKCWLFIISLFMLNVGLTAQVLNPRDMSSLTLKVFIEGPFNGTEMNTHLNPATIPLSQPYNDPLKWNYQGTENVASIPNGDVVDWVLIELRETTGGISTAVPDSMISKQAAFILKNGSIVGLDGSSPLYFAEVITGNLYVVIYHRNHLPIISSGSLQETKGSYSWDFTNPGGQAYGTGPQKEVAPGIWAMISGDANADFQITNTDKNDVWRVESGNSGYLQSDFNINGNSDNIDKIDYWAPNSGLGSQLPAPWSCGDPITDVDGNTYNTVEIGSQCWLAENLKTTKYSNGTSIPNVTDTYAWQSLNSGAYVWYDNDINWKDSYGALYNWYATVDPNGLCPTGWHVPTNDEWTVLTDFIGGTGSPHGNELKSCRQVNSPIGGDCNTSIHPRWDEHGTHYGTDDYGFSGLPGGGRYGNGNCFDFGIQGYWWTSSETGSTRAWYRILSHNYGNIYVAYTFKNYGMSVRCLRAMSPANQPPTQPSNPIPQDGSTNISIDTTLSWSCSDPNGDDLTYNIYFGTGANPPLVQENHPDTFFIPGALLHDTTYFWKIVAYDTPGDSTAGAVWSFTTIDQAIWSCGDPLIDNRDGQSYSTVQIGSQCWMAENLNIGIMINGSSDQINNSTIEKYCYNNSTANCNTYGGLYQWDEAMQYVTTEGTQGICPPNGGWHFPTDYEWMILEEEVESTTGVNWNTILWRGTDAGGNLKEAGTTHWVTPNTGATNSSGFTGLPGGNRIFGGSFFNIKYNAYFWSSSENSSDAWNRYLGYNISQVGRNNFSKTGGLSVRCLKNESQNQPPSQPSNPVPPDGASNIPIDTTFSWSCSDPNGDDLTYNIYFGTGANPPLVVVNHPDTFFIPGALLHDTTYFWKIVAYDTPGDSTAGAVWSFTTIAQPTWSCGDPLFDGRDGQSYSTVQIGSQCWMAENLNIGIMQHGGFDQFNNNTIEKYCYDNTAINCDVYGGLYQWGEAMEYTTNEGAQGICPSGWHLPTDEDWKQLEGYVDSQYGYPDPEWNGSGYRGFDAGFNLKAISGWDSGGNGTDLYGFNAMPGGHRSYGGTFSYLGDYGYWWSSSWNYGSLAWNRGLFYDKDESQRYSAHSTYGFSVRCLKSESQNQPPNQPSNPIPQDASTNISLDTTLSWSCSDPNGDDLTYNIYFGTGANPPLVVVNHPDTFYIPGALLHDTTYFWKIVAYDTPGDSTAGAIWNFTTIDQAAWSCGDLINDIDGNTYNTVQIGAQCWMAENLKTTTYSNGTPIPNVTDNTAWSNLTTGAYAWFDNDINWKDSYGALYNWYATVDAKGLCPAGWHVPTDNEWTSLTDFIGGTGSPHGNELKSCRQVNSPLGGDCNTSNHPRWNEHSTQYGTDDYGFSGLPGGYRVSGGSFWNFTSTGSWWSSTSSTTFSAWTRHLNVFLGGVHASYNNKRDGLSVRCLRD